MKIEAEQKEQTGEYLAYHGTISKFPIICGLIITVLVLMIFSTVHDIKKTQATITEQKQTIASLKEKEDSYEQSVKKEKQIEIQESDDPAVVRRKTDDDLADTMFKVLLNWRTAEEYNTARNTMMTSYGLTEESPLLQNMLPPIAGDKFGDENMRFSLAKTYELANDGNGTISYVALCRVATNISGNMGHGTIGVFYTIDGNGVISDITAYPMENY